MFQPRSIQSSLSFKDKLFAIDYVLSNFYFDFRHCQYVCNVFY